MMQLLAEEDMTPFLGRPMVHICVRLSFEERYRNPGKMLQYALLARIAAQGLDPAEHPPEVIADEQALAWAEQANAYRVNDNLNSADSALMTAAGLQDKGTGNPLLLARLCDLQAALFAHQRWLPDAVELMDRVHQLYLKVGDDHLAGRALVSQGIYTNYEGEPRKALALLKKGLALLDRERDPQLTINTSQCILEVMVQCGEYRAAAKLFLESGLGEALADEVISLTKLRWVEGQIFAGLRKWRRAETALVEARAGFQAQNQQYYAALVGLDLAEVWLSQGKSAEVRVLAEDMSATFQKLGIQREARRAVEYLSRVCAKERVTPRIVRHVSHFLRRLEREPALRFVAL